jgi:hypothetical protein
MPWLGSRKPWDGQIWDGYVERSCPKQGQKEPKLLPEPELLPKLSVLAKFKLFLSSLYLKLFGRRG